MNQLLQTPVRSSRPRIAIVTPVFNEQECLPLYEQAVRERLLARSDYDFEILFVDDGSQDRSWEIICCICERDSRFRGIRLSRNFGGHIADSAGLAHVNGDAVAILASDLQDPPEVILQFLEKWRAGAQIVWGRRRTRNDQAWRKFTSELFLNLVRRFAMPAGSKMTSGGFLLLDRKVLESLLQFEERSRIVFALVAWTGFEQTIVEYDRARSRRGPLWMGAQPDDQIDVRRVYRIFFFARPLDDSIRYSDVPAFRPLGSIHGNQLVDLAPSTWVVEHYARLSASFRFSVFAYGYCGRISLSNLH